MKRENCGPEHQQEHIERNIFVSPSDGNKNGALRSGSHMEAIAGNMDQAHSYFNFPRTSPAAHLIHFQLSVKTNTDCNPDSIPAPRPYWAVKTKTADSLYKGMGRDPQQGPGINWSVIPEGRGAGETEHRIGCKSAWQVNDPHSPISNHSSNSPSSPTEDQKFSLW